jgi:hypothetical protein
MGVGRWRQLEQAPAGRVPLSPGAWTDGDGRPLHGVWAGAAHDDRETVVVANHGHAVLGWRVPRRRWRFSSALVRASTCALAQVPWVWRQGGWLAASDPSDVAVGLVLAGRKPGALADCDDEALARRWEDAAGAAGRRATRHSSTFDCGPRPTTAWFVHVAVAGTLAQRFDLDALLADYAACLPPSAFTEVEGALLADADTELADLLDDPDLIMAATPGEYARTGLVLGYHPATTASLILDAPRWSWTGSDASTVMVNALSAVAAPAALPGLPSSLTPQRAEVR